MTSDQPISTSTIDDGYDSRSEASSQVSMLETNAADSVIIGSSITTTTMNGSSHTQFQGRSWSHPYPPIDRAGPVMVHDLPFFEYGFMTREKIAEHGNFSLPTFTEQAELQRKLTLKRKLDTATFAISCWTHTSKDTVLDSIRSAFRNKKNPHNEDTDKIQYICVANEKDPNQSTPRLHIQIILKSSQKTKHSFLAECLPCGYYYGVTRLDRAWNEYIKKGLDFIEYKSFVTKLNASKTLSWPTARQQRTSNRPEPLTDELASELIKLSNTSMATSVNHLAAKNPACLLKGLGGIVGNLQRYQVITEIADKHDRMYEKRFCWTKSFPECTPQLRADMHWWYLNMFKNEGRPQVLVLIGPTGTGKTSFALSLPGIPNHCRGRFVLSNYDDTADYIIVDDVPWDLFEDEGYPNKRDFLTGQGKVGVHRGGGQTREINVQKPAIVLLNPGQEGKLLSGMDKHDADFWKQRAYVRIMTKDEYFYKPKTVQVRVNDEAQVKINTAKLLEFETGWTEHHNRQNVHQLSLPASPSAPEVTHVPELNIQDTRDDDDDDNEELSLAIIEAKKAKAKERAAIKAANKARRALSEAKEKVATLKRQKLSGEADRIAASETATEVSPVQSILQDAILQIETSEAIETAQIHSALQDVVMQIETNEATEAVDVHLVLQRMLLSL